jgi:hypothetical protein
VFERDSELNIDRYTAKVGSQFVSSLLYGNGAIVYGDGVPAVVHSLSRGLTLMNPDFPAG